MPHERHYLRDILEASTSIATFLEGVDKDTFQANDMLRSAVLHKLTIIGEAVNHLSPELKAQHPNVPWRNVVAFRNVIVHAYFSINWDITWTAAVERVPELAAVVRTLLEV